MARKKKVSKIDEVKEQMVEAVDRDQTGTPTIALFPARNYHFKVLKGEHKITIPRTGEYHKLDPEFFSEEEGAFMLYDDDSRTMYLPAISKVLFATSKYPDLKGNQLFLPIALIFEEETVDIIGQVIEMMPPPTETSTAV